MAHHRRPDRAARSGSTERCSGARASKVSRSQHRARPAAARPRLSRPHEPHLVCHHRVADGAIGASSRQSPCPARPPSRRRRRRPPQRTGRTRSLCLPKHCAFGGSSVRSPRNETCAAANRGHASRTASTRTSRRWPGVTQAAAAVDPVQQLHREHRPVRTSVGSNTAL